jgi:Transglycosylase SLT domain
VKAVWRTLFLAVAVAAAPAGAALAAGPVTEGGLCGDAIQAAQDRHAVPSGLLFAIGEVESGRPDPVTHRLVPWPWTVQAQNQSYYFATKAEAVAWVQAAEARSILSIDVGCMQINLMYHPAAFQNLDEAFDPGANAEYAARFLVSLHATTGDWQKAAGLYHSETLALAIPYAQRVEEALTGKLPVGMAPAAPKPTMLTMLQAAWGATLGGGTAAPQPVELVALSSMSPAPRLRSHFRRSRIREAPVLLTYEH